MWKLLHVTVGRLSAAGLAHQGRAPAVDVVIDEQGLVLFSVQLQLPDDGARVAHRRRASDEGVLGAVLPEALRVECVAALFAPEVVWMHFAKAAVGCAEHSGNAHESCNNMRNVHEEVQLF